MIACKKSREEIYRILCARVVKLFLVCVFVVVRCCIFLASATTHHRDSTPRLILTQSTACSYGHDPGPILAQSVYY